MAIVVDEVGDPVALQDPSASGAGSDVTTQGAALTDADAKALQSFEAKLQMIRDRVKGVAHGYATGLFIHGPGGCSKSFTVLETLRQVGANYRLLNSRITGRGLIDELERYPESILVIEDAESMLTDKMAVGVLRSALWGQRPATGTGPIERWVTWTAHRTSKEVLFVGGIVVISNRPMVDEPELIALKTRVPYLQLQASDNELRAMMRTIATKGYDLGGRVMTASECGEVAEHVISESVSLHQPLDLRLLVGAFADYLQWVAGDAAIHWHDLVAGRIRKRPPVFQHPVTLSRETRLEAEREIVRSILAAGLSGAVAVTSWKAQTGSSQAAFYRRVAEIHST